MHDEGVGEFRTVIEVKEELNWLDVTCEVSNVHVADLANKASQAILQETLNKIVVMPTDQLRHYYSSCLPNHFFFRNVKCLASCFVAIEELSNFSLHQRSIFK